MRGVPLPRGSTSDPPRTVATRRNIPDGNPGREALDRGTPAAGICIRYGKEPAAGERGGSRCPGCVANGAANAWRARLVRAVIGHLDWDCQHTSTGEAYRDCRRYITRYVREHEVELRARTRDARQAAIAAAVAKRERWLPRHEAAASDDSGEESSVAGKDAAGRCSDGRSFR